MMMENKKKMERKYNAKITIPRSCSQPSTDEMMVCFHIDYITHERKFSCFGHYI